MKGGQKVWGKRLLTLELVVCSSFQTFSINSLTQNLGKNLKKLTISARRVSMKVLRKENLLDCFQEIKLMS